MALAPYDGNYEPLNTSDTPVPKNPKPYDGEYTPLGEQEGKGLLGHARDLGLSALKSAIAVPEIAVGLADIPTGGRVGKALENKGGGFGFRPKEAKAYLDTLYTDQAKDQQREFQQADGIIDKTKVALENPSLITNTIVESLAPMGLGGAIGRKVATSAPGTSPIAAGAIGEGTVMAGAQAEAIRQQTDDGLLNADQKGAAAATGLVGGAIGYGGGQLAQRLGIGDVDTMLAQGAVGGSAQVAKGLPRRVAEGVVSEGLLEELPQSVTEQGLQNYALDRPLDEGMADAAVMGTLAGAAMGGGAAGIHGLGRRPEQPAQNSVPPEPQPEPITPVDTGPSAGAPVVDPIAPVVQPTAPVVQSVQAPQKLSERMGINPNAGPLSAAAANAVDSGVAEVRPEVAQQSVMPEPEQNPLSQQLQQQGPVLQNRDRSTPASIAQIRDIAANPDYSRLGFSRDFANGAPVVEAGTAIPPERIGRTDVATTASGRQIPVQYAAVEASELLPSNNADGQQNADYAEGSPGKLRAIAGNGRVAGLQSSYQQGKAEQYRGNMAADAALHGVSPEAIAGMREPVLVRVMPQSEVTASIGDESNQVGVSALSSAEQAFNDARRINLDGLSFSDDGQISAQSVRQFVRAMPKAEQSGLMDGLKPSRQAFDRLGSAVFASVYGRDELTRLQAQAADPEVRTVLSGLLMAAPKMARLKDAGDLDIRPLVADAAEAVVNARRSGMSLGDFVRQQDMQRDPEVQPILEAMAGNIRSAKRIGEALSGFADAAHSEASKPAADMFGSVGKRSRADVLGMGHQAEPWPQQASSASQTLVPEKREANFSGMPDAGLIAQEANQAATSSANALPEPTQAQKEAGNYRKGHVRVNGHDISIENPAGSQRSPEWPALNHHYGYFKGTVGKDKDHVDVFLTDRASDPELPVFVVDQRNKDGSFDEHKVVMGAATEDEARQAYLSNYSEGWDGLEAITQMTQDDFKAWVRDPKKTKHPASGDAFKLQPQETKAEEPESKPKTLKEGIERARNKRKPQGQQRPENQAEPQANSQTDTAPNQEPEPQETKPTQSYGANNTLVSRERAEELRKRLKGKLAQLNSGIDPEILAIGTELAVFHIEAGVRKFSEFAKAIAADLDAPMEKIRPYLRSWYNGARDMMEDAGVSIEGMDSPDQVRAELAKLDAAPTNIATQDAKQDGRTRPNLEPNSPSDARSEAEADLLDQGSAATGRSAERVVKSDRGRPDARTGDGGNNPSADRERGNNALGSDEPRVEARDAGSLNTGGSLPVSTGGLYAGRAADGAVDRALESALAQPAKSSVKPSSGKIPTVQEIKEQMPFLTEGQAGDVVFSEKRFSKPDGPGVLFTNGTGTGKTFTGLGIIARMVANGKDSILVVAPKQTIVDAWKKAGKRFFGLNIKVLKDTKDNGGSGIVVTTYANLGDNNSLAHRDWDMVVADEAHYLSSAEDGSETKALNTIRALTKRRNSARVLVNMRHVDDYAKAQKDPDSQEATAIYARLNALAKEAEQQLATLKPEDKPHAVFLSATPFAYEKNVQWAQEFLFDWGEDSGSQSYNSGSSFDRFMMQHFGYRMRYNKLTEPTAEVDRGLMQRAFNGWLKKEGALSARALDSNFDYDRLFVTVDSAMGRRIDDALKWLSNRSRARDADGNELEMSEDLKTAFHTLHEKIAKEGFNYNARMYFLEAIKAREAVPHIKAQLAAGRKVLVMHDFKKGGVANPFMLSPVKDDERAAYQVFSEAFSDLISSFRYLPSPISQLSKAFPDALIYNGDVSPKKRLAMQNAFNDDADTSPRLIVAQGDAMREGVSIHDTTGKYPRVLVHLGMPVKPTAAIQQEGRIYRTGQASNAMFRYFTIGTHWERSAFASKIATRASAAENLAMGEQARGLKQAFIDAYEGAEAYEPGFTGEGTGGKATDRAMAEALTPWDMAKSFYFGTKKQGKGRSSKGREGVDYFATPEPVGLKMVEWADIRGGESVLEPSAGHGAIARWFPDNAKVRIIEPSAELASKAALHVDGDVVQSRFEDHNLINKYDAIVMNPPYGQGGSTAIKHLAKAADHLREGGRIVALIPTGPSADKHFERWLYEQNPKTKELTRPELSLVADISLPSVTFERAGTGVATRIVVVEKGSQSQQSTITADLKAEDSIGGLFDRLENLSLPARSKPVAADLDEQTSPASSIEPAVGQPVTGRYVTELPMVEHITKRGKVIRGVVAKDMALSDAKAIDPYAFKKDGGVFIRENYVQQPDIGNSPRFSRNSYRPDEPKNGSKATFLRTLLPGLTKNWKNAPSIEVVQSISELPEDIRAAVEEAGAYDAEGLRTEDGRVFLIADNLNSPQHAVFVLHHEVLGHAGLRGAFGDQLAPLLLDIFRTNPTVAEKASVFGDTFGYDLFTAVEEVLADMAADGSIQRQSFWGRLVAAVRSLLRKSFPSLRWTDGDIQGLLANARRYIEREAEASSSDQVRYSRPADSEATLQFEQTATAYGGKSAWQLAKDTGQTKLTYRQWVQVRTPAFKAWFGDWENAANTRTGKTTRQATERSESDNQRGNEAITSVDTRANSTAESLRGSDSRVRGVRGRGGLDQPRGSYETDSGQKARDWRLDPETGEPAVFYHGTRDEFTRFDLNHPNRKDQGWLGRGVYVASDRRLADWYAKNKKGTGKQRVMALFANVHNPYIAELSDKQFMRTASQENIDHVTRSIKSEGHDGVILVFPDGTYELMAFDQAQVKSATENIGSFQADNTDVRFSRSSLKAIKDRATEALNARFNVPGKLHWWHKTVGTMYNLAERSPAFKPVFKAAQGFIDDVSHYANESSELAPKLLPHLNTAGDIFRKSAISPEDSKAIAKPLFEGTLVWGRDQSGAPVKLDESPHAQGIEAGIVWSNLELRSLFGLNDQQIGLYHEFRDSVRRSLDTTARASMLYIGGADLLPMRSAVMDATNAREAVNLLVPYLQHQIDTAPDREGPLKKLMTDIEAVAAKVDSLMSEGYAPLSRFGSYTVDVVQKGERRYFGLFDTAREANLMAIKMRQEFGAGAVKQGTLSSEDFRLLAGVTPESLELFGNMLGLDSQGDQAKDLAFQEYLRSAKNNRSALKRLIHRKGVAGYSEDVSRVLASFIYSNARQTAAALNMGDLTQAVDAIPKEQGELKDAAVRLAEYIKNPQEEGQVIRGFLFAQYLGGSIASAFVNMTQPAAVTFPWLSQHGGAGKAAAAIGRAAKDMASRRDYEPDLQRALKAAEEDGTVSPQEVHQLMAMARGAGSLRSGDGSKMGDALAMASNGMKRVAFAWGQLFSAAEQINRRITYIAAFRMARDQGMQSPADFAKRAVQETQFIYSKAAKMRWGRGAVGGTLMTFKTYSIAYLELLGRMYTQGGPEGKKAALLALGVLLLMGGAGGLPFEEDAEDVAEGLAQLMGYNFSAPKFRQELLSSAFGEGLGDFLNKGVTGLPGAPLDVSGRLGMGNLIPGTGLLKEKTSHTRDVLEFVGPAGDFVDRVFSGGRQILKGDIASGALEMSPVAVRNAAKGGDMAVTGMYRDAKGYKVLDTNVMEAALKAVGFQPASVAKIQEANAFSQQAKNFYSLKAQEIRALWAAGVFEKKPEKVEEARKAVSDWNTQNPDQPMRINMADVLRRAREMAKSKDQRIADTAPAAMRAQLRKDLEQLR